MSDLTAYSDADLMASLPVGVRNNNPLNLKGADGSFMSFPTADAGKAAADQNLLAYGTKHGINTVAGVTSRWAPKGDGANDPAAYAAYIAQRTGIAPNQTIDLTDTPTRQALLGAMSEYETGQQKKGRDLSGVSDADLLASIPQAQPAAAPKVPAAASQKSAQAVPAPAAAHAAPTVAQDIGSGFAQPFVNLGHDVMQQYRAQTAGGKLHPASIGDSARLVGDVAGAIPNAVQSAFVRPAARAVGQVMGAPTQAPQLAFVNGNAVLTAPRQLHGDEAQGAVESALNTALAGARAAAPRTAPLPTPKPMDLEAIKAAKKAAYAAVDASGFAFPPSDVQNLASTITQAVAQKGGPKAAKLYPDSTNMAARLEALAQQPGGVPLTQLEDLRGDIYDTLVAPGGKESALGKMMRSQIDGLINSSGAPDIAAARDLNTRYMKMKALSDAAETAADKLPANGNITQPMRTQAQQLVGPKSSQRITNLTPAETAALKKLARGTANQGIPTTVGRVFDPRSLLGTTVNTMVGLMTGGHGPVITAPLGMLATAASNRGTEKGIQQLMDLFSTGGVKPSPVYPTLALGGRPAIPLASAPGLIGGSALAQLPASLRALLETSATTPTAAQPAR